MSRDMFLGIDLGTSAVKVLLANADGVKARAKCRYAKPGVNGWYAAVRQALLQLDPAVPLTDICAIGLSSQVGTYVTDTGEVIPWDAPLGAQELQQLKQQISKEMWVEAIGMDHPELISYPLPRLLYIQRHMPSCRQVVMPKELLVQALTGNLVSDIYSWRGLCHPDTGEYAQSLLEKLAITLKLPPLLQPWEVAGYVTEDAAKEYGLSQGIPVYVGCNDFYAGLLGMGILETGEVFELSGTSEHLGVITDARVDGKVISGGYFNGYATYGGTKASGVACDFAIRNFGIENVCVDVAYRQMPIFLPYLKGERAPIYDENARGVFFGITDQTTKADMAYAVLEGVVFSLYHIGQTLQLKQLPRLIMGGGSAVNSAMCQLKAALFDCQVWRVEENDSSALGAVLLAMVGEGVFSSLQQAAKAMVHYETVAEPDVRLRRRLLDRFAVYKDLYVKLEDAFKNFGKLKEEIL